MRPISVFSKPATGAARLARGEYLFFLNNDTLVCENWLEPLLAIFDRFPDAGLAGSKLLFPDGTLQEAGGIVWNDGSASNYGRSDDPDKPEYNYVREADYISGARSSFLARSGRSLADSMRFSRPLIARTATLLSGSGRRDGRSIIVPSRRSCIWRD